MRFDINKLKELKSNGQKFSMLTAYDYSTAQIIDGAGIPLILVGDSLGNVILGCESTHCVTMDDMIRHTQAVVRGSSNAMVIADMPFMSYQVSPDEALINASRLVREGGAQAVKLEGGRNSVAAVKRITGAGIPVMGHLGLTPQSVYQLGGYGTQAKTVTEGVNLYRDALSLEEAGVFAIVLELVPAQLADLISRSLKIPIIGIGAGPYCDGQVQVVNDLLGYGKRFPRHSKQYTTLAGIITRAVEQFTCEVKEGEFPTDANYKVLDKSVVDEIEKSLHENRQ